MFQEYYSKQTLHCHINHRCSSSTRQRKIMVCFVCCIDTLIWLRCYIYFINLFILSMVFLNTISTYFVSITAKNMFFLVWILFMQFDWLNFFVNKMNLLSELYWPFICMIHYLFFQTYDLTPTLRWNYNCSRSSYIGIIVGIFG